MALLLNKVGPKVSMTKSVVMDTLVGPEFSICYGMQFLRSDIMLLAQNSIIMGANCCKRTIKIGSSNNNSTAYEGFSSMKQPAPTNDGDAMYYQIHGESATFALGCFWIPSAKFGVARGVIRLRCGFIGGLNPNPTYLEIKDHVEAIDLEYDSTKTTYGELLKLFWKSHKPWEYREKHMMSAIYYHNQEQKMLAEESMMEEQKKYDPEFQKFRTQILPVTKFITAEIDQQHNLLQTHGTILHQLNIFTLEELIFSHVACRLNGYCEGFGLAEDLEQEIEDLCLPESILDLVRKLNLANQSNYSDESLELCGNKVKKAG